MSDDVMTSQVPTAMSAAADATAGHRATRLVRSINWLADSVGLKVCDLSFEGIVAHSERRVRSTDWGSDDFLERLRFAIECVEADSRLTTVGRIGASVIYNWHAANRLRIVEYVKRHPHIPEIEIEAPIFIVGWYRTATTNLHNLMSLDPNHRVPWCWELCYPLPQHPNPDRDRRKRIRRTAQKWMLADLMGPDQKYAHELRAEGPEECFFMLANSALFVQQIMGLLGYTYARKLLHTDVSGAYDDLRLQYQLLADQRPGQRWVMKCPLHMWFLDDLMRVFPDARIIHTHRAAAEAVPSVCSLSAIMAKPMAADFDAIRHGEFFREYCRSGIDRAMVSRERISPDQILDIRLSDLSHDPVAAVKRVYDQFGLEWAEEMPARIKAHLEKEELHKKKLGRRHAYSAEQFGLTAEGLTRDFADYESRFLAD
jgi:hypothetical protein